METTIEKERESSTYHQTEHINSTNLESVVLSDKILLDFIANRNQKSLKDLKGKICFRDDYDYKSMRN